MFKLIDGYTCCELIEKSAVWGLTNAYFPAGTV
jgi:hypothetical protein